jgi:hypothetical protein
MQDRLAEPISEIASAAAFIFRWRRLRLTFAAARRAFYSDVEVIVVVAVVCTENLNPGIAVIDPLLAGFVAATQDMRREIYGRLRMLAFGRADLARETVPASSGLPLSRKVG